MVNLTVRSVDLVNDTTQVEVRYIVSGTPVPQEAGVPAEQDIRA